jgi:hypothetical protein
VRFGLSTCIHCYSRLTLDTGIFLRAVMRTFAQVHVCECAYV